MANFMDISMEDDDDTTFRIAGFKFPWLPFFTPEDVKNALTFKPQPKDVIICSYPKCDSKIIDIIVWQLLNPFSPLPQRHCITNRYIAPLECFTPGEDIAQMKSPRLLKTYLPLHLVHFYKRTKYIYVVRSPWSACVCYYKLLQLNENFTDTFDEFFESFLRGDIGYACYFKHVLAWSKKVDDSNVLLLCHEHVKHNPRSAISVIAAFLGEGHLKQLLQSDDLMTDILKTLKWESFKPPYLSLKSTFNEQETSMRLHCSENQIERLVNKMEKEIKGTSIEHLWTNLLKKHHSAVDY